MKHAKRAKEIVIRKYEALPTRDQKKQFVQTLISRQYLWNVALREREVYETKMSWFSCYLNTPYGVPESVHSKRIENISGIEKLEKELNKLEADKASLVKEGEVKKVTKKNKKISETKQEIAKLNKQLNGSDLDISRYSCNGFCELTSRVSPPEWMIEARDPNSPIYPELTSKKGRVDLFSQKAKVANKSNSEWVKKPRQRYDGSVVNLKDIPSSIKQCVIFDLDNSWGNYKFQGAGKPEYKNKKTNKSFHFDLTPNEKACVEINPKHRKRSTLLTPKGYCENGLEFIKHRDFPEDGRVNHVTISREGRKWFVTIRFAVDLNEEQAIEQASKKEASKKRKYSPENTIGFDAVLNEDIFLAGSGNLEIKSLKPARKKKELLAIAQKQLADLKKIRENSSKDPVTQKRITLKVRRKARQVANIHRAIRKEREVFHYSVSNYLCKSLFKELYLLEDINLAGLVRKNKARYNSEEGKYEKNGQAAKSGLAYSFYDAAFYTFYKRFEWVALKYNKQVLRVNPAYTSKVICYSDEKNFPTTKVRDYYDKNSNVLVLRDCNSGANLERKHFDMFPSIGKNEVVSSEKFTTEWKKYYLSLCRQPHKVIDVQEKMRKG